MESEMKLLLTFCVCALMLSAADRKPAQPPKPLAVPAGAVEFERGAFRYTDGQGARWIYYTTPFGVTRVADEPVAPRPAQRFDDVTAVEDGDFIKFERPGPFGIFHWRQAKSQLNEMERAVWNRQQAAPSSSQKK
jgi:hypothetical protein